MICDEKLTGKAQGQKNGTGNVRICCMGERCGYAGFRSGVSCCEIGFFNVISFPKPQSFFARGSSKPLPCNLKMKFQGKTILR